MTGRLGFLAGSLVIVTWLVTGAWMGSAQAPGPDHPAIKLDRPTAMWLVTLPLSCIDKLEDAPKGRGYLYQATYELAPDFQKTRAFYGCFDWHSAVNSTWTLVKILKTFPDLPVAPLIREKLSNHLSADAIQGEVEFFKQKGNEGYERPYGWAWLLRLDAELKSWNDPAAQKWAANLAPLAALLLERTTPYLHTLAEPMRIGTHQNTAYALELLDEYARATDDQPLHAAVIERARTFYASDYGCAPNVEVSGADFFSPCLLEAAIMGDVLQPQDFARWLDKFMPAPDTPAFRSLLTVNMTMPGTTEELRKTNMIGAKAHLMGLGVSRARAFDVIAASLPPSDPRVPIYRAAATSLAQISINSMYEASYEGTHWIASYIVDYLVTAQPSTLVANAPSRR